MKEMMQFRDLASFVQRVDNANHWINLYPLDSVLCFFWLIF